MREKERCRKRWSALFFTFSKLRLENSLGIEKKKTKKGLMSRTKQTARMSTGGRPVRRRPKGPEAPISRQAWLVFGHLSRMINESLKITIDVSPSEEDNHDQI